MRDPARIPRLLEALESYWILNPDLRLGQLIENLARARSEQVFFIEDSTLLAALKEELGRQPEPPAAAPDASPRARPSDLAERAEG